MANLLCTLITPSEVTTGTSTKTILLLRTSGANQRLLIRRWGIFFNGTVSSATPIIVKTFKTTEGSVTAVGTAATPILVGPGSETPQSTALYNITTEPSTKTYIDVREVHPQQGWLEFEPLDQLLPIVGSSRFGIEVTAGTSVGASATIWYEE